jgi:hypothetical protein
LPYVASKSAQHEPERAEVVEELLDAVDTTIDRVKVLYEQYFLGIQKQPPTYLHTEAERKLRDLAQLQIRNTALRYRFATLQQKFGSYNSYWRRTLRQIENGTYTRNLSKIGRQAARTGAAVPEEILAAMPKRMREQVQRDREAALALARLREQRPSEPEPLTLAAEDVDVDLDDLEPAAYISEPSELRSALATGGAHRVDETDADFDLDAFFKSVTNEDAPPSLESVRQATGAHPVVARAPSPRARRASSPPPRAPSPVAEPPGVELEAELWADDPPPKPEPSIVASAPPKTPLPSIKQMSRESTAMPRTSGAIPSVKSPGPPPAPSQATRSIPVIPGASASRTPAPVESMSGPFPRIPSIPGLPGTPRGTTSAIPAPERPAAPPAPASERAAAPPPAGVSVTMRVPTQRATTQDPSPSGRAATQDPSPGARAATQDPSPSGRAATQDPSPSARPPVRPPPAQVPASERRSSEPRQGPPPGMTDADVNALYAKFVKAKQLLGEEPDPGAYGKLLKTINAQAPKIMEQYKAKGVDFSVVVKDNQVIIRAKPKP